MNEMAPFPVLLFLAAMLSPSFSALRTERQALAALSPALTNLQREFLNENSELREAGFLTDNGLPEMEWSNVRVAKESHWTNQRNYKHSDQEYRAPKKPCVYKDNSKTCDKWKKKGFCPRPYVVLCRYTCVCVLKQPNPTYRL